MDWSLRRAVSDFERYDFIEITCGFSRETSFEDLGSFERGSLADRLIFVRLADPINADIFIRATLPIADTAILVLVLASSLRPMRKQMADSQISNGVYSCFLKSEHHLPWEKSLPMVNRYYFAFFIEEMTIEVSNGEMTPFG